MTKLSNIWRNSPSDAFEKQGFTLKAELLVKANKISIRFTKETPNPRTGDKFITCWLKGPVDTEKQAEAIINRTYELEEQKANGTLIDLLA